MRSVQEEKPLMVVKSFTSLMDNLVEFPSYDISYNAVMDWFGRSIHGRASIIRFAKGQIPKCQHKVVKIVRIPRVSHRLLKRVKKTESKKAAVQQGNSQEGADNQRTPDNPICPNLEELIKAPNCKNNYCGVNSTDLEFVEIKGSLLYEHRFCDETPSKLVDKKVKKIVLGYSDEINFIQYAGDSSAACNLSHRFRNVS